MNKLLIKLPHQDPADRFIAASAAVYDLILVTADQYLIKAAKKLLCFCESIGTYRTHP
jgi:PIN domain nuclease of toxin-antitoxin system